MALFEKRVGAPLGTIEIRTATNNYMFLDATETTVVNRDDVRALENHPYVQLVGGTGGAYVHPPEISDVFLKDGILTNARSGEAIDLDTGEHVPDPTAALNDDVVTKVAGVPAWGRARTRAAVLTEAQGLMIENMTRGAATSSAIMIAGTVYVMALGFLPGDVITNLNFVILTAGSGLTYCKAALYDPSGNQVAITGDLTTGASPWTTAGARTNALTAPYTVTARGGLYVAIMATGTTLPTPIRGAAQGAGGTAFGSGMRPYCVGGTGQTSLPASIALTTGTPFAYWVGAS